jgi:membrane-associated phospholipid phosphatase
MIRRRVGGFLARRLSSEEYLGLHLTVGLLVCLLLIGVFGFLAQSIVGERALTEFDERVGRGLEVSRDNSRHVRHAMIVFTEIGSPEAMTGLTVLVALGLLMRRRRLLALIWLLAMIATPVLNLGLKSVFARDRPPFRDPIIVESTHSFPSGHSMGAVIAFGMLTYFLLLVLSDRREKVAIVVIAVALAGLIGFSRIYLGAHYFSDVVGGFAVGGAWLSVCISGAESARRRLRHRHHKTAEPPPS